MTKVTNLNLLEVKKCQKIRTFERLLGFISECYQVSRVTYPSNKSNKSQLIGGQKMSKSLCPVFFTLIFISISVNSSGIVICRLTATLQQVPMPDWANSQLTNANTPLLDLLFILARPTRSPTILQSSSMARGVHDLEAIIDLKFNECTRYSEICTCMYFQCD